MIAAMIDGVWLRAALSRWQEADSGTARSLLTAFVDGRLRDLEQQHAPQSPVAVSAAAAPGDSGTFRVSGTFTVVNPATGERLAEFAFARRGSSRASAQPARAGRAK